MVERLEQNEGAKQYTSVVQRPLLNNLGQEDYIDTYNNDDMISYRQKTNGLPSAIRNGPGEITKINRALDSPASDIRLLRRKDSVKTEKDRPSNQANANGNNSLKDEIQYFGTLQKMNTLKGPIKLNEETDLRNKNVETNIDPAIIQQQEEEKEHVESKPIQQNKKLKLSLANRNQSKLSGSLGTNQTHNTNKDNNKQNTESDQSNKRVLQTRKTDIFAHLAGEDEEILEIQLNLDEDPVTQGSVDETINVQHVQQETFIISHSGKFRIRWDLWIIILVIYNCIQIPLEIAFQENFTNQGLESFGYFVDSMFVIDIIFNFRTTYINEKTGLEVRCGKTIAKTYLKQWRFYFDLLSIIPFEFLYNAAAADGDTNSTQFKVFDLLKLIRLLRLGRIITYLKFKQDIKIGFRIVQLLCMLLLIVHWVGCIWFLIIDGSNWMPPFDANYGFTDFHEVGMWNQYAIVFYYAILLLLGSDILPISTLSTVYASLIVISGSIVTAFIFGNMAALMAAMNQKDSQFQEQFDSISNLMRAIKLPADTQAEVEAYLMHIQQVPDMQQDMRIFLKLLSPSLRSTILFHMYKTIIKKIPIFDKCSNIELRFIVNFMKTVIFLPGDEIIRQGDKGSKIYFISRGAVEIYIGPDDATDTQVFGQKEKEEEKNEDQAQSEIRRLSRIPIDRQLTLSKAKASQQFEGGEAEDSQSQKVSIRRMTHLKEEMIGGSQNGNSASTNKNNKSNDNEAKLIREVLEGDYFGEIALITNLKRTATVKAKDFTTLGYMMQKNFQASKEEFPQIYQSFKKQIKERYKDENFRFRQKMISNVPYFKNLTEAVIQELVYLLRPNRYDPGMLIVKRGDSTDKIFFLKAGIVDVEVPLKNNEKMQFDSLNAGSCFCIFSAFHEDKKQKFDFRARTVCIVESITARDIIGLQKEYLELSDELKTLMIQIENNEKSEFDFFRYVPKRTPASDEIKNEEKRQLIRKKFRMAIARFFRKLKQSKAILAMMSLNKHADQDKNKEAVYNHLLGQQNESDDDSDNDDRKHFKALHALDQLEKERREKEQKLKYLKDKCSNPSLFALTALLGKKRSSVQTDKNKTQVIVDGGLESVDLGNDVNPTKATEPNQKNNTYLHLETFIKNPASDKSIEMDISNYPKIDGIRKEVAKIREESMLNTQDINELSFLNNLSHINQDTITASKAKKMQIYNNRRIGENIRTPDFDQMQLKNNQGDDSIMKMQTTFQDQNNTINNDEIQIEDIGLDIPKDQSNSRLKEGSSNDLKSQPSWKNKLMKLNIEKLHEEQSNLNEPDTSKVDLKNKKKSLMFDNITMQKIEKAGKSIIKEEEELGDEITTSHNLNTTSGEDLLNVLNQINKNLVNQQESMTSLQRDIGKRMHKLERKLNKAIQLDGNRSSRSPYTQNSNTNNIISSPSQKPSGFRPRMPGMSDSSEPNIIHKYGHSGVGGSNLMQEKRLISHPQQLGSGVYAQSEYQFIQNKNDVSPLLRVQSNLVPRALSQNPEPLLINKLNGNSPQSYREFPLTPDINAESSQIVKTSTPQQQSQQNSQQQQEQQKIKVPLLMLDTLEEDKHQILESDSSSRQPVRVNPVTPHTQHNRGTEIHITPYFTTEYQENLVNEYNPFKPKNNQVNDFQSEKASTEHKEMAQKGPQVTSSLQRMQEDPRFQQATKRKGITTMAQMHANLNTIRDESQIDINENEMHYQNHDNTVNFEEQLDKSLERFQQIKDSEQNNNQNENANNQYYFQQSSVEYKYLCQNLQLQIYTCYPPNVQSQTPQQMINPTFGGSRSKEDPQLNSSRVPQSQGPTSNPIITGQNKRNSLKTVKNTTNNNNVYNHNNKQSNQKI